MGVVKGNIPDDLEREFRKVALERFGYKKGCISMALEEAIKLWLNREGVEDAKTEEPKVEDLGKLDKGHYPRMIKAFVGDDEPVRVYIPKIGNVTVKRGAILIPLKDISDKLTTGNKVKIQDACKCIISFNVIDDENYVVFAPRVSGEFSNPDEDMKKKLAMWFRENFPLILNYLIPPSKVRS